MNIFINIIGRNMNTGNVPILPYNSIHKRTHESSYTCTGVKQFYFLSVTGNKDDIKCAILYIRSKIRPKFFLMSQGCFNSVNFSLFFKYFCNCYHTEYYTTFLVFRLFPMKDAARRAVHITFA